MSASSRPMLVLQLLATLLILAFVPTNLGKAAACLLVWALTFWPLSRPELALYAGVCVFFTVMNALSLRQGIFAFNHPDVLLMPFYELFMWGFYILHTRRVVGGAAPKGREKIVWTLAILYSIAFSAIPDQTVLFAVTALLLVVALGFFHERLDLAYVGYMILLGAAFEYTGVLAGEWHYPGNPVGGVPPWFATLWGGVGLFLRRLVLPIVERFETASVPLSTAR